MQRRIIPHVDCWMHRFNVVPGVPIFEYLNHGLFNVQVVWEIDLHLLPLCLSYFR